MSDEYTKSVRLSEADQQALLESMDSAQQPVEQGRRAEDRSPWRVLDIPVQVTHPDGAQSRFLICIRNISPGGLSFIHGGFLYTGSKIIVQMPTIWGGIERISGEIANCRHVQGLNHEIGVRFDKPADRRRYLTLPGETPLDPDPDSTERNKLAGRVLYISEQIAAAKLVEFHLKGTHVTLETTTSCQEAIEQIKSSAIDLIMVGSEIEGAEGVSAVESVRSSGFKGPIVIVVSSADAASAEAEITDSSITVLSKPTCPASLIAALSCGLSEASTTGKGPIYSELASNPDALELVEYYLGYVEEISGRLRAAIESDEYETALVSCRTLMETGAGYGFSPISTAAKSAVTELSASMSINESISEIQRLLGVCSRIGAKCATESAETDDAASAGAEGTGAPEDEA